MTDIGSNIRLLREKIPANVKIVAVSKTMPVSAIKEAYDAGQRVFGENRVNEFLSKKDLLPPDIEWHFVGHLQTNKVKNLINSATLIHSADSLRLLQVIEKESEKAGTVTGCLLQFHIAREETKYGFDPGEAAAALSTSGLLNSKHLSIRGVMGMATFTDDMNVVREEFRYLKRCFEEIRMNFFSDSESFNEISMGMSGDYQAAVEEGATIIRIGTLIFGERIYQ